MTEIQVSPIRNEEDLTRALERISHLMELQPAAGSVEFDTLEVLSILVEAYETQHHPVDPPDPVEAIKFRMDQMGIGVKELAPLIGETNRVYEVLNKKRPLTLRMIRNLSSKLGIPASVLIL